MIWNIVPPKRSPRWLVIPAGATGFDISGWDGKTMSAGWAMPGADAWVHSSKPAPRPPAGTDSYSGYPGDETAVGVRHVAALAGADDLCAAVAACMMTSPELVVVLDSDFDGGGPVVNANPFAGGADPRAWGIGTPEHYPKGDITPVSRGYDVVPRISDGGRAWILGGGPSLAGISLEAVPEEDLVVAVNDSCRLGIARHCVFGDKRWGVAHEDWTEDPSTEYWTVAPIRTGKVRRLQKSPSAFSTDPSKISFNRCSGLLAVNFAWLAGAREIVLLGFDMGRVEGRPNWHDGNLREPQPRDYNSYIEASRDMAAAIARDCPGTEVVNLCPGSRMKSFKIMRPGDYMPGLEAL